MTLATPTVSLITLITILALPKSRLQNENNRSMSPAIFRKMPKNVDNGSVAPTNAIIVDGMAIQNATTVEINPTNADFTDGTRERSPTVELIMPRIAEIIPASEVRFAIPEQVEAGGLDLRTTVNG